jgi:hypothetical protein
MGSCSSGSFGCGPGKRKKFLRLGFRVRRATSQRFHISGNSSNVKKITIHAFRTGPGGFVRIGFHGGIFRFRMDRMPRRIGKIAAVSTISRPIRENIPAGRPESEPPFHRRESGIVAGLPDPMDSPRTGYSKIRADGPAIADAAIGI